MSENEEKKVEKRKKIKITPIKHGTVIDHIRKGQAMKVLKILGLIERDIDFIVSIAMNVDSSEGKKDIVKVEDMELKNEELDKISLVSPEATVNIIRDYEVVDKHRVKLPDVVKGILRCRNQNCISNQDEPVKPEFEVVGKQPVTLKCNYCEREMKGEEISENVI
ncbi:MAG: aspartate carbamoyltransferase regulatory subunit [Candidatus Thermoplasmatota archaeon]|nr:aspartate carbamoyltransferase regulatory subunit [Candidatus Thermoplasmatota archaeon]